MEFPKVLAVAPLSLLHLARALLRKPVRGRSTRCFGQLPLRAPLAFLVFVFLCVFASAESHRPAHITSLEVDALHQKVLVRIEADRDLSMQTMVLTHPDRIVLDAAGTTFKVKSPDIQVNAGPVKSVHIGLLRSRPPVTRIAVETSIPVTYTYRTERNSAILDIALQSDLPAPVVAAEAPPVLPPQVTYAHGLLTIVADHSSLAEILEAVRSRTGATTDFPAAAASERATVRLGPAPVVSVLAALLLGSPFDYVIVGSGSEPAGLQILLSEKSVGPEPQGGRTEAVALASPSGIALTNEAGGSPAPVPGDGGEPQPGDSTLFLNNQAAASMHAGQSVSGSESDDVAFDPPSTPETSAQGPRISKEGPRIPPPGKGH